MTELAVDVQGVTKRFRLFKEKHRSVKERILHPGRVEFHEVWALRDVAFSVPKGSTFGILGHNGSGKSTLLKTICGVLQPTHGQVVVRGKLAALLELGAGFEPELSGRDNVYLNGAMLGLKKSEIDAVFDDIVAFSELEEFIDTQVKFYSSGMYIRLGFAVAVNVDPEILVIDEVLAVGDERFQRKCLDRVREFQEQGRTIIFVSQSPEQVRMLCESVVVLHHGEMIFHGEPSEGIRIFRERLNEMGEHHVGAATDETLDASPAPPVQAPASILSVRAGDPATFGAVATGGPAAISVTLQSSLAYDEASVLVEIISPLGISLARLDSAELGHPVVIQPGTTVLTMTIPHLPLLDGPHQVNVGVSARGEHPLYLWQEQAAAFEITYAGKAEGLVALEATVTATAN